MPPMRGNIIMAKHFIHVLSGLLLITSSALSADTLITVQSKGRYPDGSWKDYPTRTLSGLSGYDQSRTDTAYSRYGGLLRSKHEATGFFYIRKIDGRWFFVDPDGYLFFKVGVAATRIHAGEPYETAFARKFGSVKAWADQTTDMFRGLGSMVPARSLATVMCNRRIPPWYFRLFSPC
jgi:hypothetical protein